MRPTTTAIAWVVAALACLMSGGHASAAPSGAAAQGAARTHVPTPSAGRDSVIKLAPGVYRVGGVTIDANRREVAVDGHVNMSSGVVELLACARHGKTHESVLTLDAEPYHIQVGLLLLGLEPTQQALRYQGDPNRPTGDSVEVRVAWRDTTGTLVDVRAEDTILDLRTHIPMTRTPWIFVGSRIENGLFEAQVEGNIVTTYHDPATIIDNPSEGGADDTVYGVNSPLVPPVGTPVTLTIRPLGHPRNSPRHRERKK